MSNAAPVPPQETKAWGEVTVESPPPPASVQNLNQGRHASASRTAPTLTPAPITGNITGNTTTKAQRAYQSNQHQLAAQQQEMYAIRSASDISVGSDGLPIVPSTPHLPSERRIDASSLNNPTSLGLDYSRSLSKTITPSNPTSAPHIHPVPTTLSLSGRLQSLPGVYMHSIPLQSASEAEPPSSSSDSEDRDGDGARYGGGVYGRGGGEVGHVARYEFFLIIFFLLLFYFGGTLEWASFSRKDTVSNTSTFTMYTLDHQPLPPAHPHLQH